MGGAIIFSLAMFSIETLTYNLKPGQEESLLHRLAVLLGGSFPSGIIQMLTMFFFLYGFLTLRFHHDKLRVEWDAFRMNLLPTGEQKVLDSKQVNEIKLKMIEIEQTGSGRQLVSLIKKACTQYRNEGSVSDTLQVLDSQVEILRDQSQGGYEVLNYVAPGISSLGFLGTVLGISGAIGNFHLATDYTKLPLITNMLNVAFDTTAFALTLSLVITYYYNRMQEEENRLYAGMKSYVIDNLISRIYHGGLKV